MGNESSSPQPPPVDTEKRTSTLNSNEVCAACGDSLTSLLGRAGRQTCKKCQNKFCHKCCSTISGARLCEVCRAEHLASSGKDSPTISKDVHNSDGSGGIGGGGFAAILGAKSGPQLVFIASFRKREHCVVLPAATSTVATLRARLYNSVRVRPERMKIMAGGKLLKDTIGDKKAPTSPGLLALGFVEVDQGIAQAVTDRLEQLKQEDSDVDGIEGFLDLSKKLSDLIPTEKLNKVMVMGTVQAEELHEKATQKSAKKQAGNVRDDLADDKVHMTKDQEQALLQSIADENADSSYFRRMMSERKRLAQLMESDDPGIARLKLQQQRQDALDRKRKKQQAAETGLSAVDNVLADPDRRALGCPPQNDGNDWTVEGLGRFLGKDFEGNLQKSRAVFRWICENIEYDVAASKKSFGLPTTANAILKKRKGMCGDYAVLFRALCRSAGIPSSEVVDITGHSKVLENSGETLSKLRPNHGWNAVKIHSRGTSDADDNAEVDPEGHSGWQLIDATWGAGFLADDGSYFLRDFDDQWFCTPPRVFNVDHFPVKSNWQLLPKDQRISWNDWQALPRVRPTFIKHRLLFENPVSPPGDGSAILVHENLLRVALSAPIDVDIRVNMFVMNLNSDDETVDHGTKVAGTPIPPNSDEDDPRRICEVTYVFPRDGDFRLVVFAGQRGGDRFREAFTYKFKKESKDE